MPAPVVSYVKSWNESNRRGKKKKPHVLFVKLGLIIWFLPQMVHKKKKAHIIHTLGQDQVWLLSGSSWRLGEELCFPAKPSFPVDPGQGREKVLECSWGEWRRSGVWVGWFLGLDRTRPPESFLPGAGALETRPHTARLSDKAGPCISLLLYSGRNSSDDSHPRFNPNLPVFRDLCWGKVVFLFRVTLT